MAAEPAAQRRVGVVGQRQDFRELAEHAARLRREHRDAIGMEQPVDPALEQLRAFGERVLEDVTGRLCELLDPAEHRQHVDRRATRGRVVAWRRLRREAGCRVLLGHRQQHANHGNAVRVAVVHARDPGAAALVVLDEVHLPHRPARIERRAGEARRQRLQFGLARGLRQHDRL